MLIHRRPTSWHVLIGLFLSCAAPDTAGAQMTTNGVLPGASGWYLPTADGAGELFVFELGRGIGDPVVVLHGGPGADLRYLLPIANGLESAYHFVFYDQRGSLLSRVTPDSITMPKHVEDLERLRLALGAERLKLVSHSAGTMLAFAYLQAHPARLSNLVLVGALPHKNGGAYYDAEYAALWRGLPDSAERFASRDGVKEEIRQAGLSGRELGVKEKALVALIQQVGAESYRVDRWREALPMRVNPEAARRTRSTTNFTYDVGPRLARHGFPVTVINGEFDYTVGPRDSPLWRRLAATTAPNVRVMVLGNASHIVWRDAPDAFRKALSEALR
jgi:pimeloyl-ACP methyl ester carboxylesterase